MDARVKKLSAKDINDFSALLALFAKVFQWDSRTSAGIAYLQEFLRRRQFWVFVATIEQRVVGGLTAYALPRYDAETFSVYVYDVAVAPEWQRRGIGKKLMAALTDHCRKKGAADAFVQADTDDAHALAFYRQTEASSEVQATQYTYSFSLTQR